MSASLKWAVIIIDELQFFVSVFCLQLSDTVINCSLKLKLPNKGYILMRLRCHLHHFSSHLHLTLPETGIICMNVWL